MFGVALPGRGSLATPEAVLRIAGHAEGLGFTSLFVTDHVVLPASDEQSTYPYATSGRFPGGMEQDYLEPLTLLGHLAHATRRARLGTSVLVIPYRNPVLTAKMLASLDVLSGGRIILGAGVGWLREEFEALAAPSFEERGRVTDEYLTIMRACWARSPVSYSGRYYAFNPVYALPQPPRGGIPVWIGGHTESALRRVAAHGDGWHPIAMRPPAMLEPADYALKAKQIRALAAAAGRDPDAITLTVRAPMRVTSAGRAAGQPFLFQGGIDEIAADIRAYRALGVSEFIFDAAAPTDAVDSVLENLERFARDVRPRAE